MAKKTKVDFRRPIGPQLMERGIAFKGTLLAQIEADRVAIDRLAAAGYLGDRYVERLHGRLAVRLTLALSDGVAV